MGYRIVAENETAVCVLTESVISMSENGTMELPIETYTIWREVPYVVVTRAFLRPEGRPFLYDFSCN